MITALAAVFALSILLLAGAGSLRWRISCRAGSPQPEPVRRWRVGVPRDGRFPAEAAAAWFAALAPLAERSGLRLEVELLRDGRGISLLVGAPDSGEAAVRGQLAAWFPGAELELNTEREAADSTRSRMPLQLEKPELYPLRRATPRGPDPLLAVLGALVAELGPAGMRLALGPPPRDWRRWAPAALAALRAGRPLPPRGWRFVLLQFWRFFQTAEPAAHAGGVRTERPDTRMLEEKARGPVFSARAEVWADAPSPAEGEARALRLAAQIQYAFRDPLGNAFVPTRGTRRRSAGVRAGEAGGPSFALSASELGALFHLPAASGVPHPLLPPAASRTVPPHPNVLPHSRFLSDAAVRDFTVLGEALGGARPEPFGLTTTERRQHLYVVGKTGTGKSTLLGQIARQDLAAGRGLAVLDPHGDLAERLLAFVPRERRQHTVYWDPADTEHPIGLNPLAPGDPTYRYLVASGVVGTFRKLWGDSWGPRLEHLLRNACLALLETPAPTLLLLPRLLTDRPFRQDVAAQVRDPVLRSFWTEEFEGYGARWQAEAAAPILNKVGQFLAAPPVRLAVGQSGPGLDFRELLDGGGVLIANLSVGRLGEDNARLLGGLLVSGLHLAALSRASRPETERREFGLLADEFPHFANEAFGAILSEARKYGLSLALAHQYLDQIDPAVAAAVFGNTGSLAVFRTGQADAPRLVRELAPSFDIQDLVHLENYRFCARIGRAGAALPAFSARTVPLPNPTDEVAARHFLRGPLPLRSRSEVELEIADAWEGRST